jgi:hypothetical protein
MTWADGLRRAETRSAWEARVRRRSPKGPSPVNGPGRCDLPQLVPVIDSA